MLSPAAQGGHGSTKYFNGVTSSRLAAAFDGVGFEVASEEAAPENGRVFAILIEKCRNPARDVGNRMFGTYVLHTSM